MKLTEHFTLAEMTRSATATKHGINNQPTSADLFNLICLCVLILEPLRQAWGKPIIITSGYRCPELNKMVGGVANSYHTIGMAADIRCSESEGKQLMAILRKNAWVDSCLFEHSGSSQWLHVQISTYPRHLFNENYKV